MAFQDLENQVAEQLRNWEFIWVDGNSLKDYNISAYKFSKKEIDYDSGRGLDGVMQRNVLAHHARTIDITFTALTGPKMAKLLQILDKSTLSVVAYDPNSDTIGYTSPITMYHGDLTPELDFWDWDYTYGRPIAKFKDLTVQLVEY